MPKTGDEIIVFPGRGEQIQIAGVHKGSLELVAYTPDPSFHPRFRSPSIPVARQHLQECQSRLFHPLKPNS